MKYYLNKGLGFGALLGAWSVLSVGFLFASGAIGKVTLANAGATDTAHRVLPPAYFQMPHDAAGPMPKLLSQTGVYKDTANLVPADGLLPYDLVVAFWSDGAIKTRHVAIPKGQVKYSATTDFIYPAGTVFVKTFNLPTDAQNPQVQRRLETRLLVVDARGGTYGVDYKWRADNSDADLLSTGLNEDIPTRTKAGTASTQNWYYPSREDCATCHNAGAGGVLGLKARQMNHDFDYGAGKRENELKVWSQLGLFDRAPTDAEIAITPTLAAASDTTRSIEDRARSYLDANCSHCHHPGGTVANFDARYQTTLDQQALIEGPVLIDEGIDHPHVISPHDIWRSIAYMRVNTTSEIRMPPIARQTIDPTGVMLLQQWIDSMPGRAVVEPPTVSPGGGNFDGPIEVTISVPTPDAQIYYTLDGSAPNQKDALYDKPLKVDAATVVRARAFRDGMTRSIAVQQLYVIGK